MKESSMYDNNFPSVGKLHKISRVKVFLLDSGSIPDTATP